jgi:2-polyprenyl-6-methoxyphenol hydroxylase-like FAD-dependent oxidoreductase
MYFTSNFAAVMTRTGLFATGFCDKKKETMYWFNSHEMPPKDRDGWTAYGAESGRIKEALLERVKDVNFPLIREVLDKSDKMSFYPIYSLPLGGKWYTRRTILLGDAGHGMSVGFLF